MKFNKKILSLAATLALASSPLFAASASFTASIMGFKEPTITESTALNFGRIALEAASSCAMDNTGAITGACDTAASGLALGAVTLSGLAESTTMDITVTGSTASGVAFAAAGQTTKATGNATTVDGVATSFTTDNSGTDVTLNVFGTMTVGEAPLVNGVALNVPYTVAVSFQ